MKHTIFVLFAVSLLIACQQTAFAQVTCTDPGGCSLVSFAAFPHNVGVIEFGNTTGKVVSKTIVNLCPEQNCNQFFTMTTALLAPRTNSTASKPLALSDITLIAVRRALTSAQTGVYSTSLPLEANAFRSVNTTKRFSGFPLSLGFGDNALAFLTPGPNAQNKLVTSLFNPATNSLTNPKSASPNFRNELASTINREGSVAAWINRADAQTVNLNIRRYNLANRNAIGPPEIFPMSHPVSQERIETISSIALSDPILTSASPGRVQSLAQDVYLYKTCREQVRTSAGEFDIISGFHIEFESTGSI